MAIDVTPRAVTKDEPLRLELEDAHREHVVSRQPPVVTGAQGLAALEVASASFLIKLKRISRLVRQTLESGAIAGSRQSTHLLPPAPVEPVELDLLRKWREPVTSRRFLRDALGSLAVHAVVIVAFWLAPEVDLTRNAPVIAYDLKRSVKLTLPRYFEPTQKAPNLGKVKRELDDRSAVEGTQPQARRYRPPSPAAGLPQPAAASMVVEAPHLDLPQIEGPRAEPATLPSPNLPPVPSAPRAAAPESPARRAVPPPPSGAGIAVGDTGIDQPSIAGSNPTPSPCQTCSTLQLLSNPQNVDFQPYLLQVLRVVKQNWLTVIPAEARQGRRGNVTVRFVIDKKGVISNLIISAPSGTGAFDLAAATGLSMSNSHFPPLPAGYNGDEIRLQMTFAYNSVR